MKILIDCVVTAADPARCSSNIQFLTFVRRTLAARPDVFFYWLIPEWITAEQFDKTYPQDARVMYRRVPQHRDRTKEYLTVSKALDRLGGVQRQPLGLRRPADHADRPCAAVEAPDVLISTEN